MGDNELDVRIKLSIVEIGNIKIRKNGIGRMAIVRRRFGK